MSIGDHGLAAVSDRPVTFEAAQEVGAFRLAEQWADRMSWPWPGRETARDELAELAHMSALAAWLRRWRPIHVHGALLSGARPGDVAAAFCDSLTETYRDWHEWASGQRTLGRPGISEREFAEVAGIFAAAGLTRKHASQGV
jgi:hypothetical protein